MGLYLCVFDDDDELEGVEVGSYSDFGYFRDMVTERLEDGLTGREFPILNLHSDCDGEWSPAECERLREELMTIAQEFKRLPPVHFRDGWQQQTGELLDLKPTSLFESFIDVDGEPLLDRLVRLCDVAIEEQLPIVFQ
jgi:hypothetical protein